MINIHRLAHIRVAVAACVLATIAGAQETYPTGRIRPLLWKTS